MVYSVTNNNIRDLSVSGNPTVDQAASFGAWVLTQGGLAVDIYLSVTGNVANVMARAATNVPSLRTTVRSFDWGSVPLPQNNGLTTYGAKVWGWFLPPSNGVYRFYTRSDDANRLYMNTNGQDRGGAVLIAAEDSSGHDYVSGTNILTGSTSNSISSAISLTNGTAYYIEGWFWQGTGQDRFQVDFRADGAPAPLAPPDGDGYPAPVYDWPGAEVASGAYFGLFGNPDAVGSVVSLSQQPSGTVSASVGQSVTFSALASAMPVPTNNYLFYQWQTSPAGGATWTTVLPPPTNFPSDYAILGTGTNYTATYFYSTDVRVIVTALPGGGSITSSVATVTVPDSGLNVVSVGSLDGNSVVVVFDRPVNGSGDYSAADAANYTFNGDLEVNSAVVRPDGRSVVVVPGSPLSGGFTLEVRDVNDLSGGLTCNTIVSGTVLAPAFFNDVGATPGTGDPLLRGSALSTTNNGMDVVAGGSDIWSTNDGLYYIAWPLTGDFDVRVRVPSMTNSIIGVTAPTAKAGLMARVNTNANSRLVAVDVNPPALPWPVNVGRNTAELLSRDTVGGQATNVLSAANAWSSGLAPWVRLVRSNAVFFGYYNTNGGNNGNWTLVGTKDTSTNGSPFPQTIDVGLATSAAHNFTNPVTGLLTAQYRDLHLPAPPTAELAPLNPTLDYTNGTITFTATVLSEPANSGPLWVKWYKNGALLPGATTTNLTLNSLSVADSGTYAVLVGNDGGASPTPLNTTLTVTNGLPVVTNDLLVATQNVARTFAAADLLGNDADPEGQPLSITAVYGQAVTFATDFQTGLPTNTAGYGPAGTGTGAMVTNGSNGYFQLTAGAGGQSGSLLISNLTPNRAVSAFTASFKVRISDTSAEPADGFSFNVANNLPDAASGSNLNEDGQGTGLSICYKAYRFQGVQYRSGLSIRYGGNLIVSNQVPTWNNTNFIPMQVSLTADGKVTVSVNSTNVFTSVPTPWVPVANGRFGFYARTGGAWESHAIDDLSITAYTLHTALGNTIVGGTVTATNGVIYYAPPANACGSDSFYYLVSDGQGTTLDTATVALRDLTAPVITCPASLVTNASATCGRIVNFTVTALDNCDGSRPVTCSPAPGSTFLPGLTAVTCEASDTSLNTNTCSFTVTVVDTTAPALTCPGNILTNITGTSVVVDFVTSATDNCDGSSVVTCTPVSGSSFSVGTNTVTCETHDTNLNTNTCAFTVTVQQVLPMPVTGSVALEAFVGATRAVTFKATDGSGTVLAHWTVSLNFLGGTASYSLENVPVATTHLSAKTAWNLRKKVAVAFGGGTGGANFTGDNTLPGGDLTGTNGVDLDDYYRLANAWYQRNDAADIDGSGLVDLDDYFLQASHWLDLDMAE